MIKQEKDGSAEMSGKEGGDGGSSSGSGEVKREDILSLMDDFIEQVQRIKNILFGMSLSAIILAPLAIALSLYLIIHPSFFAVLEIENEFGWCSAYSLPPS